MQEQLLDDMDLERERGITIKAHPVTMHYHAKDGEYLSNQFDRYSRDMWTSTYEVSRSLSACEGALLVVDAGQGVQAQSLANVHLALERNSKLFPSSIKSISPQQTSLKVSKSKSKMSSA